MWLPPFSLTAKDFISLFRNFNTLMLSKWNLLLAMYNRNSTKQNKFCGFSYLTLLKVSHLMSFTQKILWVMRSSLKRKIPICSCEDLLLAALIWFSLFLSFPEWKHQLETATNMYFFTAHSLSNFLITVIDQSTDLLWICISCSFVS